MASGVWTAKRRTRRCWGGVPKSGIRYGTVDYMAPEMYHKQGGDSRIDLYSLAVMIYELLNGGRLPLQQGDGAENRKNAWKQRLDELKPVPPLKGIPADVNEALLRCLESDPKRRFANCRDAADTSLELYMKYRKMRGGDLMPKGGGKWLTPVLIGALALGVLGVGAIVAAGLSDGGDQPAAVVVETQPAETQPVETQIPVTPTPEPEQTAEPVALSIDFDSPEQNQLIEGSSAVVSGRFSISQGELALEDLVLFADGREWEMEITPGDKGYSFRSELQLDRAEQFELGVGIRIRIRGTQENLASGVLSFEVVTPTPTATPTPTVTPTPVPVLALSMEEETVEAGTGNVTLHGRLTVEGELSDEKLALSVNGSSAQTNWQSVDGGYEFTASLEMDLEGMDALEVRVGVLGNPAVEAAQTALPVVSPAPSPEPTPETVAPIALENAEALEGCWFGSDGVLRIAGTAQAGKVLNIAVNGEIIGNATAEADGRFEVELLSGSLQEGMNAITLAYAQVQSEELAELNVGLDTIAPVVSVETQIDQNTAELSVQIEDADAACTAALSVDGEMVREAQAQDGKAVLEGIDSLPLYDTSEIVLTVTDRAGNVSERNIAYERTLVDIRIVGVEEGETLIVGDGVRTLDIYAEPGSEISVELNGKSDLVYIHEATGSQTWTVEESRLLEGENRLVMRYVSYGGQPVKNDHVTEVLLWYDTTPPNAVLTPQRLYAGDERTITVEASGEEWWLAVLYVDHECICSERSKDGNPLSLTIPDDIVLSEESDIVVWVCDRMRNGVALSVQYEEIQPLGIDCGDEIWGTESGTTLNISGEADAWVNLQVNGGEILQTRVGEPVDIARFLRSGTNTMAAWYAEENAYPEKALEGTNAEATVEYDPDLPMASGDVGVITRDTESLTLTVSNESNGYWAKLLVDGEVVWSQEDIYDSQITINGIDQLNLSEDQVISLEVGDGRNPPYVILMSYFDITRKPSVAAFGRPELPDTASAGDELALDVTMLCSRYRMSEGYVNVYLSNKGIENWDDEDSIVQSCHFNREETEWTDEITAQLSENSIELSDEVDACYSLTGVTIPADCAEGHYTLVVSVEEDDDRYTLFYLGELNIAESAAGSGDSEMFCNEEKGYAIGFDGQLQPEFRSDNVVLTGWVAHAVGSDAYFDSCVILDSYGREMWFLPIGEEELSQYPRSELPVDAAVLNSSSAGEAAQLDLDDSGFVLKLDLSDAALDDGDEYELQLYSSNEIGEKWAMISTKLLIRSTAPEVDEAALAGMVERWKPLEAAEEPTP